MIADILRGSKNEKIRRFGLETLSTWGIMSDTGVHRIRLILDHLIDEGILLLEEGEYPVVTLGGAEELLRNETRVLMKLPQENKKPAETKVSRQDCPAKLYGAKLFDTQSFSSEIDEGLLDKLRKLRKEIAAREAVPAYVVFSDASLRDMCRKKPASLAQFFGVNGVGQVKLEKYGEVFTELIREHCNFQ